MKYIVALAGLSLSLGCSDNKSSNSELDSDTNQNKEKMEKYAHDSHSFSEPNNVATTHLDLNISVSFDNQTIQGTATYDLERNNGNNVKLDIRGLEIVKVTGLPGNAELPFEIIEGNERGNGL